MDFPGGSEVKSPPANAGDTGLIPGPRRFHTPQSSQVHAPQLLSLCSGAREPHLLKPVCSRAHAPQQEKPLQWEAHALRLGTSLCLPQLEKARVQHHKPSQK